MRLDTARKQLEDRQLGVTITKNAGTTTYSLWGDVGLIQDKFKTVKAAFSAAIKYANN